MKYDIKIVKGKGAKGPYRVDVEANPDWHDYIFLRFKRKFRATSGFGNIWMRDNGSEITGYLATLLNIHVGFYKNATARYRDFVLL